MDLSKACDTVNHSLILKKLEIYGIHGKNLEWFKSYLRNRKKYIQTILFLLYVNDLPKASKILDPIIFADDTNLFFSNCDIPVLLATVNSELSKIKQWFPANKLFLNVTKTKYSFFYKTSKKYEIPLKLPRLQINNCNI